MSFRRRGFALCFVIWTMSGAAPALAETSAVAAGSSAQTNTVVPPQVAYNFSVTNNGTNVGTVSQQSLFGTVTLSCLGHGVAAIVGRDVQNKVIFENVARTPPTDDLALRPYSRAFSEIRRTAWSICAPEQPAGKGEQRTVEQKGAFVLGGFTFPDEIKIQDKLGSIGCEAAASDKMGKTTPCTSKALTQPFVSLLMRKLSK